MRLSKPVAILVLLASLVPVVYIFFFFATMILAVAGTLRGELAETWFLVMIILHILCILWLWALLAFYLVFLFKTEAVPVLRAAPDSTAA